MVLRSTRFNVFLLIAIAGASALGTLLPQAGDAPERVDLWLSAHPAVGPLFQSLGFFDLYGSRWFAALLALVAIDIALCKLAGAPSDGEAPSKGLRAEFETRGPPPGARGPPPGARGPVEEAGKRVKNILEAAGYHADHRPTARQAAAPDSRSESGAQFTRHRAQRWGAHLAHAALVAILAGGVVKRLFGFVEMVPVVEGGSGALRHKPGWELRVDRFDVQFYDRGLTPKLFSSELKVYDGSRELGAKTIRVNDPLDIRGVRFYQASWGVADGFRSATLGIAGRTLVVEPGAPTRIPGTKIVAAADAFLPAFAVAEDGHAASSSAEPANPAVRFRFRMGGQPSRPLWLLLNEPGLAFYEGEDGKLEPAPPPPFRLAEVDPVYFSGIQVAYDPGFKLVLGGSAAWLAGLLLLFHLHRRRIWIDLEPAAEGGVRARASGWSSRGDREFRREFEALARRLQGTENAWN